MNVCNVHRLVATTRESKNKTYYLTSPITSQMLYTDFHSLQCFGLQCFDIVGWAFFAGRDPVRKNLTDEVLAWLSPGAKCE